MIGAVKHLDKELEVLHRSVRVINDELMEIEADQKHVPRLLEDLGLVQGNVVIQTLHCCFQPYVDAKFSRSVQRHFSG